MLKTAVTTIIFSDGKNCNKIGIILFYNKRCFKKKKVKKYFCIVYSIRVDSDLFSSR